MNDKEETKLMSLLAFITRFLLICIEAKSLLSVFLHNVRHGGSGGGHRNGREFRHDHEAEQQVLFRVAQARELRQ